MSPTPTRKRVERKRPRRSSTGSPFTSSGSLSSMTPSAQPPGSRLGQARRLHELRAIGGLDGGKARTLVARERQRHLDAGGAQRPDLPIEFGQASNLLVAHGQDHVALLD